MSATDVGRLSIAAAATALRSGEMTAPDLLDAVLDRIERDELAHNGRVDAWAARADPSVLRTQARRAQQSLLHGQKAGPLFGIPYGVKDMIDTADLLTEAGSQRWRGRRPAHDAHCVWLAQLAGGLLVGKTRTHEFACGVTTPPVANPWNPTRTAGGSSGGSAAAVATGQCLWALGTDTLGSVRMPAAFCGVVGLKPTRGLIGRTGVVPLSWTLDHVGVLTRDTTDAGLVLDALLGHDRDDPESVRALALRPPSAATRPLVVGVAYGNDPEVEQGVLAVRDACVQRLRESGVLIRELNLRAPADYVSTGFGIMAPEAASWHEPLLTNGAADGADYQPEVRAMLEAGTRVTALDYLRARRARSAISSEWTSLLHGVDAVLTPSVPYVAPAKGTDTYVWSTGHSEPYTVGMCRFTAVANATGLPAVSVPAGLSDGLPVGIQFIGRPFDDHQLLALASLVETVIVPV